jgi:nucleotide-binding universal stress UspA family protein
MTDGQPLILVALRLAEDRDIQKDKAREAEAQVQTLRTALEAIRRNLLAWTLTSEVDAIPEIHEAIAALDALLVPFAETVTHP